MGSEKIVDLSLNSFPICMGFTEPPFLCLNSVPTFVECFSAPQPSARSGGGPTLPIRRLSKFTVCQGRGHHMGRHACKRRWGLVALWERHGVHKSRGEGRYFCLGCATELPRKVVLGNTPKGKQGFICGNLASPLCPKKSINRSLEVGGKVEFG